MSSARAAAWALAILGGAVVVGASPAGAQTTPSEWIRRAEDLERAGDPAGALEAWTRVRDADPRARLARRADRRIAWLEERREQGWEPLAALMRFQALSHDARDEAAILTMERATESMPEGRVRVEARLAVAGAWSRLGDPRAVDVYRVLLDEPAIREGERALAREALAQAHAAQGDTAAALAELEAADLRESGIYGVLERSARARFLEPLAWALVATFVLAVLAALWSCAERAAALRAALAPSRLALAIWLGLAPYAIAHAYGDESHGAFALLAPASALVLLLAHVAGASLAERPAARASLAALAALAAIAAGYLAVLHRGEALPFA